MITPYCLMECSLSVQEAAAERLVPEPLWIDVCDPAPEDIALLQGRYGIPPDFVQAALDKNERPRLEQENGITLVLARASQGEEPRRHLPFATCPVAIIVTGSVLVTVCNKPDLVRCLLSRKLRAGVHYRPARLALSLLMRMSGTYIDHLHQMDDCTEQIEQSLHESMQNSELVRMLHIEKSLIYVLTSIKGNHAVLDKLYQTNMLELAADEKNVLSDVLIENRQAVEMAEVFSQILVSLGDAFGTMVSNNLNKVMKVLTGVTIVLMIPTIIAGVYGMNVPLPMQEYPHAFIVLCAVSVGLCSFLWVWFKKKNWL